jgi:hypothetical protein
MGRRLPVFLSGSAASASGTSGPVGVPRMARCKGVPLRKQSYVPGPEHRNDPEGVREKIAFPRFSRKLPQGQSSIIALQQLQE